MPNNAPKIITGNGTVITRWDSGFALGRSLALQADGKMLVGGDILSASDFDFGLVRYNRDGTLDTTFGTGGVVVTPVGNKADTINSVVVQPNGKIVVAGYTSDGLNTDFALARYNANGTLDTTFGSGGKIVTPVGAGSDAAYSVALQPDGKIVVAGTGFVSSSDIAVTRYNANGTLDTTFGAGGVVTTPVGAGADGAYSVAVQPNGKIVVAGYAQDGSQYDIALARLNADGSLDGTFGTGGVVKTPVGGSTDVGQSVVLQPDGKIVVSGYAVTAASNDFALLRYNSDGSLDGTFGTGGVVVTSFGISSDIGQSVVVQPDGKIVVGGYATVATNAEFALARYNADGTLDTTFGTAGKVVMPVGPSTDAALSVKLQADGKIVLAGYSVDDVGYSFALARLNKDGTPDGTFGASRFTENGAGVVIDRDLVIRDADLTLAGSYNGASLTLLRSGGASGQDLFGASGTLAALVQGDVLLVDGVVIGTVTKNSGGILALSFNTSATETLLDSALRQITYRNGSDAPPASVALAWTLSDGNTGAQGTGGPLTASGISTVMITPVNDAPRLVAPLADRAVAEDGAVSFALPAGAFADVDNASLAYSAKLASGAALSTVGLAFNAATKTFTGKPPANFNGAIDIKVTASDGKLAASDVFRLTVTPVNDAPRLAKPLADRAVAEDAGFSFALPPGSFADVDNPSLVYRATLASGAALPAWLKFSAAAQTFSGKPPANWSGAVDVKVTASDGKLAASDVFRLSVTPVNDVPVITSGKGGAKATYSLAENKTAVAALRAADADGNALSWSLSGKDAKLFAVNSKTGALSFKAAPDHEAPRDAGRNNTYDVTVRASDGKLSDTQALSIKVTNVKGVAKNGTNMGNTLSGTGEEDTLKGRGGNDKLNGNKGNDTLYGEAGNDRITGGQGADKLYGGDAKKGSGLDTFVFTSLADSTAAASGRDTIFDFGSGDRIDLGAIDASTKKKGNQAFSFVGDDKFLGKAGELRFEKKKSDTTIYADVNGDKKADLAIHLDDARTMGKGDFLL